MPEQNKSIQALAEIKDGSVFGIASTETEDRMGDVIKSTGWDLESFKKNPVIQFAHNYNEPPVGVAKNIKVENKKLTFEVVFHSITEQARQIGEMYKQKIMRAFSVGFIPLKIDENNYHIIEKAELLEISAVPVPANAEALSLSIKSITPEEKAKVDNWVKGVSEDEPKKEDEEKIESIDEEKEETTEEKEEEKGDGKVDEQKEPEEKEPEKEEVKDESVEEEKGEEKEEEKVEEGLDVKFIVDEKKVNFDLEGIKKDLMEQLGEKAGRVISKKNRTLINNAIEQIETTAEVLHNLLDMSDDSPIVEYPDAGKGRGVEARKSRKKRIQAQALRKIDKLVEKLLRQNKQS